MPVRTMDKPCVVAPKGEDIDYSAVRHRDKPFKQNSKCEIKYVESSFKFHGFRFTIGEMKVVVNVIGMNSSVFLWLGDSYEPMLGDLSVAMTPANNAETLTSKLLGLCADATSTNFAARLARKLKKQVFVSFNVKFDRLVLPAIERGIIDEINANPQFF